jgi:hypothetical protein
MSKPEQKQDDLVTEVGDQNDFDQAAPMEDEEEESDEEEDTAMSKEFDEMHDRVDKMEKHIRSDIAKGFAQINAKLDSLLLVNQALMPGSPVIPPQQTSPQKPKANKKKGGK